jgi:hypothetical protein
MNTTRLAPLALAVLAAAALAGCGDPLFFAEVKEERICLALPDRTVPAAPGGIGEQTVTWSGDLDLGSQIPGLDRPGVTGSIRMLSMTVAATLDLSGVTQADVSVSDAAGAATPFMHLARPALAPERLDMALDQDLNLLDRLRDGALRYDIAFRGTPPTQAWGATIETCLAVEVKVDALKAMQQ